MTVIYGAETRVPLHKDIPGRIDALKKLTGVAGEVVIGQTRDIGVADPRRTDIPLELPRAEPESRA